MGRGDHIARPLMKPPPIIQQPDRIVSPQSHIQVNCSSRIGSCDLYGCGHRQIVPEPLGMAQVQQHPLFNALPEVVFKIRGKDRVNAVFHENPASLIDGRQCFGKCLAVQKVNRINILSLGYVGIFGQFPKNDRIHLAGHRKPGEMDQRRQIPIIDPRMKRDTRRRLSVSQSAGPDAEEI